MVKMSFPQIKKTISSFLSEESGKISKNSLLKLGVFAVVGVIASADVAAHTSCSGDCTGCHGSSGYITCGHGNSSPHASGNLGSTSAHANAHCSGIHDNSAGSKLCYEHDHGSSYLANGHHFNNITLNKVGTKITANHTHSVVPRSGSTHYSYNCKCG
ncbi:hypothetical protein ACFLZ7_03190 [Nanoarchaeota archaeon]